MFRRLKPKTPLEGLPLGVLSCVPKGVPGGRPLVADVRSSLPLENGRPVPTPTYAWGIARQDIVRVEVHLADGSVHRAPVYEHVFGVGVPPDSSLVSAVGFDANGRRVGSYRPGAAPKPKPPAPAPARTGPYLLARQRLDRP